VVASQNRQALEALFTRIAARFSASRGEGHLWTALHLCSLRRTGRFADGAMDQLHRKDKALAETAALLVLSKNSRRSSTKARTHDPPGRPPDPGACIEQARADGARLVLACALAGIDARTLRRWTAGDGLRQGDRQPDADRPIPSHALSETERARIIAVANEPRFAETPPARIVRCTAWP
jgi:hypothetical protein